MLRLASLIAAGVWAAFISGSTAQAQVTLHLRAYEGVQVNAIINWGSPAANASCQRVVTGAGGAITCPAAVSGDRIRVSGTVPQFGPGAEHETGNTVSRVVSWGDVGLRSLDGAFRGNSNLSALPETLPRSVVNLSRAFQDASGFSQDLSSWGMNVRQVEHMDYMFDGANNQSTDLAAWCLTRINQQPAGLLGTSLLRRPIFAQFSEKLPVFGKCGAEFELPPVMNVAQRGSVSINTVGRTMRNSPGVTRFTEGKARYEAVGLPTGLVIHPHTGVISRDPAFSSPLPAGQYPVTVRLVLSD